MRTRIQSLLITLALWAALNLPLATARAQGTAFTYQGQLSAGGSPANGIYDLRLLLFNAPTGNGQMGITQTNLGVGVTNGLFTLTVDFGPVFNGASNWLRIDVRTNGGSSFIPLAPRQELTPTPYAIFADTAGNVSGVVASANLSGTYGNALTLNNAANSFTGNGGGLTGLNASQLTGGTVPDAQLSGNVALLNANQTFAGSNVFSGPNASFSVSGTGPISTGLFTGLGLQFYNTSGEGAILSSVNDANSSLTFYTKAGPGYPVAKQMKIDRYGVVMIDQQNVNNGVLNDGTTNGAGLTFGLNSGEGIASQRTPGVNKNGLDFYTGSSRQMSILSNGNIGMGVTNPTTALQVNGTVKATAFAGDGGGLATLNALALTSGTVPNTELAGFKVNNSTVAGGQGNSAGGQWATVAGGYQNSANFETATVGGGADNQATYYFDTVAGGQGNIASGEGAFIGGGGTDEYGDTLGNTASGEASVIGGGAGNLASGEGAFIGGGGHDGTNFAGNTASGAVSVIGGGLGNQAANYAATVAGGQGNSAGGRWATVAGGYQNSANFETATIGGGADNQATYYFDTVAGGQGNIASGEGAFIGGGGTDQYGDTLGNTASGTASVIGGGSVNLASGSGAFIGGGNINSAIGPSSVICGGGGNTAKGSYSTVPGGVNNQATGNYSIACGYGATAAAANTFVWADGAKTNFNSGGLANSFSIRATGGVYFCSAANSSGDGTAGAVLTPGATAWTTLSDRKSKKNFQAVDTRGVLEKLAAIPMQQWNYKWEKDTDVPNIGPMAQDFKHAFFAGRDDKGISTLEFDGVELAAIQGLNQKLNEKDTEIQTLKRQNDSLAERLNELEATVKQLAARK